LSILKVYWDRIRCKVGESNPIEGIKSISLDGRILIKGAKAYTKVRQKQQQQQQKKKEKRIPGFKNANLSGMAGGFWHFARTVFATVAAVRTKDHS
jgi:hypothetical protein